jgi:hypothetical protein
MNLDIRIPIGLMFGIIGMVLVVFGMISNSEIYSRSLGININFWWGLVMLIFSAVMLMMAWRKIKK